MPPHLAFHMNVRNWTQSRRHDLRKQGSRKQTKPKKQKNKPWKPGRITLDFISWGKKAQRRTLISEMQLVSGKVMLWTQAACLRSPLSCWGFGGVPANVAAVAIVSSTVVLYSLCWFWTQKEKKKLETHPNHLKSPETNIVLIVLINICLMAENIPSLH